VVPLHYSAARPAIADRQDGVRIHESLQVKLKNSRGHPTSVGPTS
jgi:hypothetical protein